MLLLGYVLVYQVHPKSTSTQAHTYNYFPGTYTYKYAYTQNGDQ